jgi:hypothetical protein
MTQTSMSFDRPSPKDLGFKPGSQNDRLYRRLLLGPATNAEVVREMGIFNSTGRCADIRRALRPHLMDVAAREIGGGLWEYRIAG